MKKRNVEYYVINTTARSMIEIFRTEELLNGAAGPLRDRQMSVEGRVSSLSMDLLSSNLCPLGSASLR